MSIELPPRAGQWGNGDGDGTISSACSPDVGGDNLGYVAPSPASLTYGQISTRGRDGLAPPSRRPVSIGPRTARDPVFMLSGRTAGSCRLACREPQASTG